MASKLKIINAGLYMIGVARLASLSSSGKNDVRDKALDAFDLSKDEVFELPIDWNFATSRKELAQRTETPSCGYDYMYNLPPNLKRIQSCVNANGDEVEYEWRREVYISGSSEFDVMLTDRDSPVYIKYTVERKKEGSWPAYFAKLVSIRIAEMLAEPLKKSETKAQKMEKRFEQARIDAESANNMEIGKVTDGDAAIHKGNTDVIDAAEGDESTTETPTVIRVIE
jgi:hypothetical protein